MMSRSPGSQPGEASSSLAIATVRDGVEGVGILHLTFNQDSAGSIPVAVTNGGVGKRVAT
jgi:hypothetical protein